MAKCEVAEVERGRQAPIPCDASWRKEMARRSRMSTASNCFNTSPCGGRERGHFVYDASSSVTLPASMPKKALRPSSDLTYRNEMSPTAAVPLPIVSTWLCDAHATSVREMLMRPPLPDADDDATSELRP